MGGHLCAHMVQADARAPVCCCLYLDLDEGADGISVGGCAYGHIAFPPTVKESSVTQPHLSTASVKGKDCVIKMCSKIPKACRHLPCLQLHSCTRPNTVTGEHGRTLEDEDSQESGMPSSGRVTWLIHILPGQSLAFQTPGTGKI